MCVKVRGGTSGVSGKRQGEGCSGSLIRVKVFRGKSTREWITKFVCAELRGLGQRWGVEREMETFRVVKGS